MKYKQSLGRSLRFSESDTEIFDYLDDIDEDEYHSDFKSLGIDYKFDKDYEE